MVSRCLVLTVLVACGPVKGNPPDTDATTDAPDEPGFTVTVRTANVVAPLDGKATFEVAVTRTGGFDGEVQIAPVAPPNGLEIAMVTVAGDAESSEVELGALAPLAIGDTVDFDLEATATGLGSKTISVDDAEITGKPGSLDISFGVGTGYASISFGSDDGGAFNALDVLGGKVTVTGIGAGGLGAQRFSTMRFLDTGAIDTTFAGGTLLRTTFRGGSNEDTRSAAIGHQIDGRTILIGSNHSPGTGETDDVVLARLETNGSLSGFDFGNGAVAGKSILDLGGTEVIGSSFFGPAGDGAVLPDGKIVAVGQSNGHHVVMLAGLGGNPDNGFNTTGSFKDVLGTGSIARKVAVDSDGNFIVAGQTSGANGVDLTLHRYTTSGLDTTFGASGRTIITTPGVDETVVGLVVGSQNKIFLASLAGPAAATKLQLRRFDADGAADTSFGTNGLVEIMNTVNARAMLVLPDGKFVVLGQNGDNALLQRFLADGTVDPRFGASGVVSVPFGDSAEVNTFIVYDAHKIVVAGGNVGGVPGPGTKGLIARIWM